MQINKQLKVKIISMLVGLAGFGIITIVGMNLFQNLMASVTSMSMTTNTGMVEIPSINDFFMRFIDSTTIFEIVVSTILIISGTIGYMWYPIIDFKNQLKTTFNITDPTTDDVDELIKKHCYK